MRTTLLIAAAALALAGAEASAQRVVMHGPAVGAPMPSPAVQPMSQPAPSIVHHQHAGRWGSKVGGHWWGGVNAPGGWQAYRRPTRGWALPSYWVTPRFYVTDWSSYGLSQPPLGYNWSRYYDDAVLIDSHGSVYDSMDGLDWDRSSNGSYDAGDRLGSDTGERGYDHDYDRRHERREDRHDGVAGAVIGGAVGGVAGNVIAGRGNRLGGTLIGAGVGAAAGYAIDKARDHERRPPPGYGADYPPPIAYHDGYPHERGYPPHWVSPDGMTTVTTTSGGYYGGSTTTVVVQTAPVVTTTTEIYEDAVTYTRPVVRKVWRKRVWRRRPRCGCR